MDKVFEKINSLEKELIEDLKTIYICPYKSEIRRQINCDRGDLKAKKRMYYTPHYSDPNFGQEWFNKPETTEKRKGKFLLKFDKKTHIKTGNQGVAMLNKLLFCRELLEIEKIESAMLRLIEVIEEKPNFKDKLEYAKHQIRVGSLRKGKTIADKTEVREYMQNKLSKGEIYKAVVIDTVEKFGYRENTIRQYFQENTFN
jgi:hypothetical protein